MNPITQALDAVARGDPHAADRLLPLVYDELRRLAAQKLAQEKAGQTLQATALVHEAYLRLTASGGRKPPDEQRWDHRGHFFAAAAEAMRRILVENARRKRSLKRGGAVEVRRDVDLDLLAAPEPGEDLIALDEALERLAAKDPVKAEVVKLRFFVGLSSQETALALGISRATADRYWNYARAWLYRDISGQEKAE
ncbi:MAG TPA: ECF-type sigma factor [Gemmataceae bacterium]|nr:ECF-type sigma factor [Gemmataceae bacterium]